MSALRTVWLLMRMRLTRQRNQISNNLLRFRKKATRDANGGKQRSSWLLTLVVTALMLFSFTSIANNAVLNMHCHLTPASACAGDAAQALLRLDQARQELAAAPFSAPLMRGLTMEVSIVFCIAVLLPMASKEMAQPDWDLEWLVTMPVPRGTLLWGRVLERSVANGVGWLGLLPAYGTIAWHAGAGWLTLPVAMGAGLLLPLAALLHTLADTGLRMWLPASQLRNLQAVLGLLILPLIYLVMALGMPQAGGFAMGWAGAFPAWMAWLPPGLLLQAIEARDGAQLAARLALLLAQTGLLLWAGMALLRHQLRHGVVNSGTRESVRRTAPAPSSARLAATATLLTPVQRRELRLLSRDRNFMFQTLLLPIVIIGSQLVFNGKLNSLSELGQNHALAATLAFIIGVYVLMLSAFQTLNNEGQSLWLLYAVPRSLESVLKEKAQLWAALTLAYPAAILGISAWYTRQFEWSMLGLLLEVAIGMPIYATIAVALGVFACDPLAVTARNRVRPTYVYLYMLLASFYTWSIYSHAWQQKLVVMVLTASLALALWQKERDALPYLLDPAAAPPARVSTADGLIAATAFFIVQAVVMLRLGTGDLRAASIAFGSAGLTVYLLVRLVYWRSRTGGVPAILRGTTPGLTLRSAAPAAALACIVGVAYLGALQHSAWWPAIRESARPLSGARGWMLALALVAAPLCEEFIFRGLLYGGLRRSMAALPAMLMSAAVFAVVHPPVAMPAVFVLGLCLAWCYERSRTLLAPMLVHAAYNAIVLSIGLRL